MDDPTPKSMLSTHREGATLASSQSTYKDEATVDLSQSTYKETATINQAAVDFVTLLLVYVEVGADHAKHNALAAAKTSPIHGMKYKIQYNPFIWASWGQGRLLVKPALFTV